MSTPHLGGLNFLKVLINAGSMGMKKRLSWSLRISRGFIKNGLAKLRLNLQIR